jgi:hypothetical protein
VTAFEAPRTVYKLEFEGEEFGGLVVRVRALTFAELRDNRDLLYSGWETDQGLDRDRWEANVDALHQLFADHLVDWNLSDGGEPVPATLDGLRSQEGQFIGRLVGAWRSNTIGVSVPLEQPSADGEQSVELSIPMESLSESLAS